MKVTFILFAVAAVAIPSVFAGVCDTDVDPDSKCALQCLFYPRYTGGHCDENKKCICHEKNTVPPQDPNVGEALNKCVSGDDKDRDAKCYLQCLFYPNYKRGECKGDICYCFRV